LKLKDLASIEASQASFHQALAHIGETIHDEINLQQVASEMTFVSPPNEGRYTTKGTS